MPGVHQHTRDSLRKAVAEAAGAGLGGVMLFAIPTVRDAVGSQATDPDGILNLAIADTVAEVGDALVVQADLCLDEFTDHGHCGVLTPGGCASTTTRPSCGTPRWPSRRPRRAPTWSGSAG